MLHNVNDEFNNKSHYRVNFHCLDPTFVFNFFRYYSHDDKGPLIYCIIHLGERGQGLQEVGTPGVGQLQLWSETLGITNKGKGYFA